MLSAEIWRRSVPVKAVLEKAPCVICPLFEMGIPSTTMLEPKAAVLLFTNVRNWRFDCCVRSWLPITCPGSSCMTSAKEVACRWSMACRPTMLAVEAPLSRTFAVTVTSFSANDDGTILSCRVRSLFTTSCCSIVSMPT